MIGASGTFQSPRRHEERVSFSPGLYRDSETGRYRWAVLVSPSNVWQFPKRYGEKAARQLAERLERQMRT